MLTPNLPETQVLTGVDVENAQDADRAARILQDAGVKTVVIKGGHSGGSRSAQCTDWVFLPDGENWSCRAPLPDAAYARHGLHVFGLRNGGAGQGLQCGECGENGESLYRRRHRQPAEHRFGTRTGQPLGVSGLKAV